MSVPELDAPDTAAFHFIITVSRAAAEFAERHEWRGDPVVAHWALDVEERGAQDESAVRDAFWTLSRRIRILASLPHRTASRHALEKRLHALQAV